MGIWQEIMGFIDEGKVFMGKLVYNQANDWIHGGYIQDLLELDEVFSSHNHSWRFPCCATFSWSVRIWFVGSYVPILSLVYSHYLAFIDSQLPVQSRLVQWDVSRVKKKCSQQIIIIFFFYMQGFNTYMFIYIIYIYFSFPGFSPDFPLFFKDSGVSSYDMA